MKSNPWETGVICVRQALGKRALRPKPRAKMLKRRLTFDVRRALDGLALGPRPCAKVSDLCLNLPASNVFCVSTLFCSKTCLAASHVRVQSCLDVSNVFFTCPTFCVICVRQRDFRMKCCTGFLKPLQLLKFSLAFFRRSQENI